MPLKTTLDNEFIDKLEVVEAAVGDGYWEDRARDDIQYVYLLGQLQCAKSLNMSYDNLGIKKRVRTLSNKVKAMEKARKDY